MPLPIIKKMKKKLFFVLIIISAITLNAQETDTLKAKELTKGAYRVFNEFLSNTPSITDSFYVKSKARGHKNWRGTYSLIPKYSVTNKKIKHIWGFCDGKKSYIMHQSEFFPIEVENGQYSFIGYDLINNSGAGSAGVLGGAIGGGIYAAAALSKAKNNKIKYIIDTTTGEAIHPNKPSSGNQNLTGARLIVYRRASKESDIPFEFIVNDSLTYSFIPNSFIELNFGGNTSSTKICYGTNFSKCLVVDLSLEEIKYIQCSILKKNKTPQLIEVKTSKGEFDSYKPKKAQIKREKNNW